MGKFTIDIGDEYFEKLEIIAEKNGLNINQLFNYFIGKILRENSVEWIFKGEQITQNTRKTIINSITKIKRYKYLIIWVRDII